MTKVFVEPPRLAGSVKYLHSNTEELLHIEVIDIITNINNLAATLTVCPPAQ